MSDIVDTQRVGFTFIWKIENFSLVPRLAKNEKIQSRVFVADNIHETCWYLQLKTPGYDEDRKNTFLFYLIKSSARGSDYISFDYEISIISNGDSKIKSKIVSAFWFEMGDAYGIPLRITRQEIFSKGEILPGDTLTVQCKIWYHFGLCLEPGFCLGRTRIGAERKTFTWTVDKFSTLQANDKKAVNVELRPNLKLSLTITLFLTGTPTSEERIRIKVEGNNDETFDLIITLGISVQNINGKAVYHSENDFKLSNGKEEWPLSLILEKKQFASNKDLLLPDDVLSLKCVLVISKFSPLDSIVLNEIESTTYGPDAIFDLEAAITNMIESPSLGKEIQSSSNSLTNDMRHLFEDKYLADINIRVGNEVFPAHKAVLASRSSVFKTMFDTDMKEKFTNTVKIDDFEPDVIYRLLVYMYSDTWDNDIYWESASSLYLAAEKYAVPGLKENCSSFLKKNITITNVCKILVLADMLIDEELKNSAQNFIQNNDSIMNSNEWKHFSLEHPQLTVDILTRLYRDVKLCKGC